MIFKTQRCESVEWKRCLRNNTDLIFRVFLYSGHHQYQCINRNHRFSGAVSVLLSLEIFQKLRTETRQKETYRSRSKTVYW